MEKLFKQKQVFLQIPANENYANVFKDKYKVRELDDTIYLEEREDSYDISNSIHIDPVRGVIELIKDGKVVESKPIVLDYGDEDDDFLTEEEKKYDKPAFQRNKKPKNK